MSKSAALDFDALDVGAASAKPFEFELEHPVSDKGLGVFVSVFGPESDEFKNRVRREENRKRHRAFEAKRKARRS